LRKRVPSRRRLELVTETGKELQVWGVGKVEGGFGGEPKMRAQENASSKPEGK